MISLMKGSVLFSVSIYSYLQTLEWILIYSTVPITFHVITNEDSVPYVTKVLDKLNETSECDFTKQILTLSEIILRSNNEICPKLGVRSEFCEIVMGNMTPLLFPWLFTNLDHAIYVDRNMVFQVYEIKMFGFIKFTYIKLYFSSIFNIVLGY